MLTGVGFTLSKPTLELSGVTRIQTKSLFGWQLNTHAHIHWVRVFSPKPIEKINKKYNNIEILLKSLNSIKLRFTIETQIFQQYWRKKKKLKLW
jgi:hypothetical protein